MTDLEVDLRLAYDGSHVALMHVFDATVADAWTLTRCVLEDEEVAAQVLAQAYVDIWADQVVREASSWSARARVMAIVYDRAKAARDVPPQPGRPPRGTLP